MREQWKDVPGGRACTESTRSPSKMTNPGCPLIPAGLTAPIRLALLEIAVISATAHFLPRSRPACTDAWILTRSSSSSGAASADARAAGQHGVPVVGRRPRPGVAPDGGRSRVDCTAAAEFRRAADPRSACHRPRAKTRSALSCRNRALVPLSSPRPESPSRQSGAGHAGWLDPNSTFFPPWCFM